MTAASGCLATHALAIAGKSGVYTSERWTLGGKKETKKGSEVAGSPSQSVGKGGANIKSVSYGVQSH